MITRSREWVQEVLAESEKEKFGRMASLTPWRSDGMCYWNVLLNLWQIHLKYSELQRFESEIKRECRKKNSGGARFTFLPFDPVLLVGVGRACSRLLWCLLESFLWNTFRLVVWQNVTEMFNNNIETGTTQHGRQWLGMGNKTGNLWYCHLTESVPDYQ